MAATVSEATSDRQTIDPEFLVEAIKSTTREVCSTMLMMEAEPVFVRSAPPLRNSELRADRGGLVDGVLGIIGIAGTWVGTGLILCSPHLACKASSAMMMSEHSTVDGAVLDAMGEIANMIIGNIKTMLEDKYGSMGISVPTVVYGRNLARRTISRGEWVIVGFHVAGGQQLEIHLNLTPNPAPVARVPPGFVRTEPLLA